MRLLAAFAVLALTQVAPAIHLWIPEPPPVECPDREPENHFCASDPDEHPLTCLVCRQFTNLSWEAETAGAADSLLASAPVAPPHSEAPESRTCAPGVPPRGPPGRSA